MGQSQRSESRSRRAVKPAAPAHAAAPAPGTDQPHQQAHQPDQRHATELELLGQRLYERRAEVARRADECNRLSRVQLSTEAHASVARITEVSTEAFARWLSGEGADTAREVGYEAATIFGQLAIQREAPLHELSKRTLRWRDATRAVLEEVADELGVHAAVRAEAERMLRRSADVTLVRLCE